MAGNESLKMKAPEKMESADVLSIDEGSVIDMIANSYNPGMPSGSGGTAAQKAQANTQLTKKLEKFEGTLG